jgi:flagellar basal body rod protein FlgB
VPSGEFDPNRNTVSIERELMFAAESRQQFDRAVAVYKSSLNPAIFMA